MDVGDDGGVDFRTDSGGELRRSREVRRGVSLVTEGEALRWLEHGEWVGENFAGCELGHVQRTRRLMVMAENMLECPEASLPKQNVEWSDVKAAYRPCD